MTRVLYYLKIKPLLTGFTRKFYHRLSRTFRYTVQEHSLKWWCPVLSGIPTVCETFQKTNNLNNVYFTPTKIPIKKDNAKRVGTLGGRSYSALLCKRCA